jgi:hypothetical protein
MNRFPKFIATGALVMLSAGPAVAQQAKELPGKGGQVQGQPTAPQRANYGGINQSPWFGHDAVRDQLKISADQYTGLNKAYGDAWTTYNGDVGRLGAGLTEQQRAQKLQEYQTTFNQSVRKSVDGVISDPQQRERYNQLYFQYQGYGAFNDPTLQQKLNLTNEQREKFAKYGEEWNQQMGVYHQNYQTDPDGTTTRYNDLRKQTGDRYNSILNAQQQQIWRQITGTPYNFHPSVYFHGNGNVNEGSRK